MAELARNTSFPGFGTLHNCRLPLNMHEYTPAAVPQYSYRRVRVVRGSLDLWFLVGLGWPNEGYLDFVNRKSSRVGHGLTCAHFMLKPTSIHLTQAYLSQNQVLF
jgi:hypothetical protein